MATSQYDSKMFYTYLDGDKAWDLIEKKVMGYDVSLDALYPEHFITEVTSVRNEERIKSMLLPDEQYYMFSGDCDNYAITSLGRIFNAKYETQSKVYIAKDRITTNIRATKVYFAAEFMKQGWSFNIDEIKRNYDKNKWAYHYKGINHN
jgi:hypothetical protein